MAKESTFVKEFLKKAKSVIIQNGLENIIEDKANLYYQLSLDKECKKVTDFNIDTKTCIPAPKRGYSAFQTDICIFHKIDKNRPVVVIEFKTKITTHDILTYSNKAGKHKKIYPALRYGLMTSDMDSIPKRFFLHNENLDFFYCAKPYRISENKLQNFINRVIVQELNEAKMLEDIYFNNNKICEYSEKIYYNK